MKQPPFPTPLTRVVLETQACRREVTLPSGEVFRVKAIFGEREYAVAPHFLPRSPISVVDVGANVGLFTLYMKMTHAVQTVHCFEPAPASIELLNANLAGLEGVHTHPFGLANRDDTVPLILHPRNSGQNRLGYRTADRAGHVEVPIRDAAAAFAELGLTYIDVLKIDTEGCEVPILESLAARLTYVGVILIEYHSENDRRRIDQLLSRFTLIGAKAVMKDVGILKFINRRLLTGG